MVYGANAALSLEADYGFANGLSVRGGVQYGTIGRTALELRPSFSVPMSWITFHAQTLLHYTNLSSVHNAAAGVGVGLSNKYLFCDIGYYYRTYGGLNEPFNIFYSLGVNFLPSVEDWDLHLIFTNCEIFELERLYQPSYIVRGNWAMCDNLGVVIDLNYKPAGMFNMSSNFYQLNIKAGLCYKW